MDVSGWIYSFVVVRLSAAGGFIDQNSQRRSLSTLD
jgi:hypothetical protein